MGHGLVEDGAEGFALFVVIRAVVAHVELDAMEEVAAEVFDFCRVAMVLDASDDAGEDFAVSGLGNPDALVLQPCGRVGDRLDQHRTLLKECLRIVRIELVPQHVQEVFDDILRTHSLLRYALEALCHEKLSWKSAQEAASEWLGSLRLGRDLTGRSIDLSRAIANNVSEFRIRALRRAADTAPDEITRRSLLEESDRLEDERRRRELQRQFEDLGIDRDTASVLTASQVSMEALQRQRDREGRPQMSSFAKIGGAAGEIAPSIDMAKRQYDEIRNINSKLSDIITELKERGRWDDE